MSWVKRVPEGSWSPIPELLISESVWESAAKCWWPPQQETLPYWTTYSEHKNHFTFIKALETLLDVHKYTCNSHCHVTLRHLHRVQRSPVLMRKSAGETECSLLLLLPPVLPALPYLLMLKSSHSQETCLQNDVFLKHSALLMHTFSLQLSAHGNLLPCAVGVPGQELMLWV